MSAAACPENRSAVAIVRLPFRDDEKESGEQ